MSATAVSEKEGSSPSKVCFFFQPPDWLTLPLVRKTMRYKFLILSEVQRNYMTLVHAACVTSDLINK